MDNNQDDVEVIDLEDDEGMHMGTSCGTLCTGPLLNCVYLTWTSQPPLTVSTTGRGDPQQLGLCKYPVGEHTRRRSPEVLLDALDEVIAGPGREQKKRVRVEWSVQECASRLEGIFYIKRHVPPPPPLLVVFAEHTPMYEIRFVNPCKIIIWGDHFVPQLIF